MRAGRTLRLSIAGALVALLTAACGSSTDTSGSGSGNGLQKTTLTVGTMPIFDTAPLQLAIKNGFFKEKGLTIKLETVQGGADGIPKLRSGSLDITVGNYVSAFLAESQGAADLHLAAEDSNAANQSHTIMAMPDSGIRTVKDLEGATIAVNTRHNIATLLVKSVLRAHGVNPKSVTFTEIPAPNMPQVLASGEVDAAQLIEPFGTVARQDGARLVTDAATGPTKNFPIAGWYTTQEFYEKYTEAVLAFRDAVQRGAKLAHDKGKVEQIIPTYTKVSPETAAAAGIINFPTTIDPNRLQRVPDLMHEFGLIEKQLDAAEVLGIKGS